MKFRSLETQNPVLQEKQRTTVTSHSPVSNNSTPDVCKFLFSINFIVLSPAISKPLPFTFKVLILTILEKSHTCNGHLIAQVSKQKQNLKWLQIEVMSPGYLKQYHNLKLRSVKAFGSKTHSTQTSLQDTISGHFELFIRENEVVTTVTAD